MAFTKMKIQQIEQLAGQSGPAMQRLGSLAQAVTLSMQETLAAIGEASELWDNGAGAVVEATATPTEAPAGSPYSQAQWMAWLSAQAAIVIAASVPLQLLPALVALDEQGNPLLDGDGNPIRPFAAMDPAALSLVGETDSIKSVVWRDPVMGVAPTE